MLCLLSVIVLLFTFHIILMTTVLIVQLVGLVLTNHILFQFISRVYLFLHVLYILYRIYLINKAIYKML